MSTTAPPTFIMDGTVYHVTEGPATFVVTPRRQSATSTRETGLGMRQVVVPMWLRHLHPDTLFPDERVVYALRYDYKSLEKVWADRLDAWRSRPTLAWRAIEWGHPLFAAFTGDGTSRVLRIYHTQALDAVLEAGGALPGISPGDARSMPVLSRIVEGGPPVPVLLTGVNQPTWAGGEPPAGEGWWLIGSQLFRLAEAPAFKEVLQLRYLPVYEMVEDVTRDAADTRQARRGSLRQRDLKLLEAGE